MVIQFGNYFKLRLVELLKGTLNRETTNIGLDSSVGRAPAC